MADHEETQQEALGDSSGKHPILIQETNRDIQRHLQPGSADGMDLPPYGQKRLNAVANGSSGRLCFG